MLVFGVSLSSCSPFFAPAFAGGGDDGNRTHDPLLAGQVLSQLSYTPILNEVLYSNDLNGHSKLNNKICFHCYMRTLSRLSRFMYP